MLEIKYIRDKITEMYRVNILFSVTLSRPPSNHLSGVSVEHQGSVMDGILSVGVSVSSSALEAQSGRWGTRTSTMKGMFYL